MFPHLVQGLERSVPLDPAALEYFHLHINLDVEHGKALEEGLLRWATTAENQEDMRRGARRSLEARGAFWSALGEQLFPDLVSAHAGSRTL
jgi:pyrroloquinoline quinone (PQQ) biosynthesis protein C